MLKDILSRSPFTVRQMLGGFVFVVIFVPTFTFLFQNRKAEERRERKERGRLIQSKAAAESEMLRRQAEKEKSVPSTPAWDLQDRSLQ